LGWKYQRSAQVQTCAKLYLQKFPCVADSEESAETMIFGSSQMAGHLMYVRGRRLTADDQLNPNLMGTLVFWKDEMLMEIIYCRCGDNHVAKVFHILPNKTFSFVKKVIRVAHPHRFTGLRSPKGHNASFQCPKKTTGDPCITVCREVSSKNEAYSNKIPNNVIWRERGRRRQQPRR
jgi:hypothetical protein